MAGCSRSTQYRRHRVSFSRGGEPYVQHYHGERNHQGLANQLIVNSRVAANDNGEVICDERLGGLLKYYRRAA